MGSGGPGNTCVVTANGHAPERPHGLRRSFPAVQARHASSVSARLPAAGPTKNDTECDASNDQGREASAVVDPLRSPRHCGRDSRAPHCGCGRTDEHRQPGPTTCYQHALVTLVEVEVEAPAHTDRPRRRDLSRNRCRLLQDDRGPRSSTDLPRREHPGAGVSADRAVPGPGDPYVGHVSALSGSRRCARAGAAAPRSPGSPHARSRSRRHRLAHRLPARPLCLAPTLHGGSLAVPDPGQDVTCAPGEDGRHEVHR